MKKIYSLLVFCFSLILQVSGQNMQAPDGPYSITGGVSQPSPTELVFCGLDTINYPYFKTSSLQFLSLNNASSGYGLSQYFSADGPVTIYGATVFGNGPGNRPYVDLFVSVYRADTDSLPVGAPLAVDTIQVDSMGNLSLLSLARRAVFSPPVVVNGPYILVVENPSPDNILMVTNSYNPPTPDGRQEWLSSAKFSNGWVRGYTVTIGAPPNQIPFDADVILLPWVTYPVQSLFVADSTCLQGADSVHFTDFSSPISSNKMYNNLYLSAQGHLAHRYNFGDGSPVANVMDTVHFYSTTGPDTVTYTTTVNGWYTACNDVYTVIVGGTGVPTNYFTWTPLGFAAIFDESCSGAFTWDWDFGDGATSTQQDPTHTYAANGTYYVSLITSNLCGMDTLLDTITINCTEPAVEAGFTSVQSFYLVTFTNTSTNSTSWSWTFGDGGTSTLQNPNHIYASTGWYIVTLIAKNLCFSDTIVDSVFAGVINRASLFEVGISFYPNPASTRFFIETQNGSASLGLTIFDLNGKMMLADKEQMREGKWEIPVDGLSPGLYLVKIFSNTREMTVKLQVMR